jgi:hypothetical protein
MIKEMVEILKINGVPSSLNLSAIGGYINNGTTIIEIKRYIDQQFKV